VREDMEQQSAQHHAELWALSPTLPLGSGTCSAPGLRFLGGKSSLPKSDMHTSPRMLSAPLELVPLESSLVRFLQDTCTGRRDGRRLC
jgi:hypothetical protein